MLTPRIRKCLVFILLTVWLGQAFAAMVPAVLDENSGTESAGPAHPTQEMNMHSPDGTGMDQMGSHRQNSHCQDRHCSDMDSCPDGHCSPIAAVTSASFSAPIPSAAYPNTDPQWPTSSGQSHFRPPIVR